MHARGGFFAYPFPFFDRGSEPARTFLGAALGTALLLPLAGAVLVFAALGFGLALPFLLIAFVPVLRNRTPF